jgi:hypothetical protein
MNRLTDTAIRAVLGKARTSRVDLADGAVPGLTLRIGRTRGATWSLLLRVVGEGGITGRGALKGRMALQRGTSGEARSIEARASEVRSEVRVDSPVDISSLMIRVPANATRAS